MSTLVLCLATSVLFAIVSRLNGLMPAISADLLLIVLIGLMVFPQYVVVPYDTLTYLFLALAISLILWGPSDPMRRSQYLCRFQFACQTMFPARKKRASGPFFRYL
jgi:hypothetical protein